MTNHLIELREYMEIASSRFQTLRDLPVSQPVEHEEIIVVQPDHDPLLEQLEILRFKLENHRQMTGSYDYALGYEEACMKVVEMIDGILRGHGSEF